MDWTAARYGPFDHCSKMRSVPNGPRANDCSGYLSRPPLFGVLENQIGQRTFVDRVHNLSGSRTFAAIHPHVDRPRIHEREAAIRSGQLKLADAEVGDQAVDFAISLKPLNSENRACRNSIRSANGPRFCRASSIDSASRSRERSRPD